MTRRAIAVALAALIAGCGSGGQSTDPDKLAGELAQSVHDRQHGSRLADAACIKRTDREFVCTGDFRPSRAEVVESLNGISTDGWKPGDWAVMTRRISGQVTYDVTVDPDDDSFIAQPR